MTLHTIYIDPELNGQVISADALGAACEIESSVLISARAFYEGEETPGGVLEAVEYTCYPADSEEGDGARPRKVTLWVGLDPDVGCVNVDAGRERLESEGWQVSDWGSA